MAEVAPAEQRAAAADAPGHDPAATDAVKEDKNQAAVLSDPKAFVDRIASFFNQPQLSDVNVEVGIPMRVVIGFEYCAYADLKLYCC